MRKLKGFTLVEILIVIVIIGILIGALVPRMQSAQGRARDVARKNDLSQLQAAIVTSFQDRGEWPGLPGATAGIDVSSVSTELLAAGMNGVPQDPLSESSFVGVGEATQCDPDDEDCTPQGGTSADGQYRYIVLPSYGSEQGGFALMAKTEVEGGSNRVVCSEKYSTANCNDETPPNCPEGCQPNDDETACVQPAAGKQGYIKSDSDIKDLKPCSSLKKVSEAGDKCVMANGGTCIYGNESQLRYVLVN